MRILLDEQLPRQLAPYLVGHDVRTVFVTGDQNLEFQQNIANRRLGVVVLCATSNALEDLLPLVPAGLTAIATARPGQLVRVAAYPCAALRIRRGKTRTLGRAMTRFTAGVESAPEVST